MQRLARFCGSSKVWLIPREQQFAEKIHAYTLPRGAPNSRVKDLVDLAILSRSDGLDPGRVLEALRLTFERMRTHDLPAVLPSPPADWQGLFDALAAECGFSVDIHTVYADLKRFFDGMIAHDETR